VIGILGGTLAGVALGVVSGLFPGIHSNTLAAALLGLQALLIPVMGAEALAAAMFAALITHTFLDSIPSTFLGIPDPDTSVSVLPAHMLCLEGKGEEAVRVAALGSASGMIVAIPLCALLFFVLPPLQPYIDWWIGILLVAVSGLLIIRSDSPLWALLVFGISGILGIFTFRYSFLGWHVLGESGIMMPLLTGLFGISVLLFSSRGALPLQKFTGIGMGNRDIVRGTIDGAVAGTIVGWLPGLSNAAANTVLCTRMDLQRDRRRYLFSTNAANTVNAVVGLAALYAIGRERNGVMVAMAAIELPGLPVLLACGALSASVAYIITVRLAGCAGWLNGIDGTSLNTAVISVVITLCFLVTGPFGLFILLLATVTGVIPQLVNVSRVFCMGAIMIPVMLYSFGITGI
jgi:putative membrane protein